MSSLSIEQLCFVHELYHSGLSMTFIVFNCLSLYFPRLILSFGTGFHQNYEIIEGTFESFVAFILMEAFVGFNWRSVEIADKRIELDD